MFNVDRYSREDLESIKHCLNEGQNPAVILPWVPILRQYLWKERGEYFITIFHQHGVILPEICLYGNERLLFLRRCWWNLNIYSRYYQTAIIGNPKLYEYPFWSKVTWDGRTDLPHLLAASPDKGVVPSPYTSTRTFGSDWGWLRNPWEFDKVPKAQAIRLTAMLYEKDLFWTEEWRVRNYDWFRSKSGGLMLKDGAPDLFTDLSDVHLPDPQANLPPSVTGDFRLPDGMPAPGDLVGELKHYKDLAEGGKMSEEEFFAKRKEILSKL
jgi:hypothetical protein